MTSTTTATILSDTLSGTSESDIIFGLEGNDLITAGDGNDTINGNQGDDDIRGGSANDVIYGGQGDDLLDGDIDNIIDDLFPSFAELESGNDLIFGNLGADFLFGNRLSDTLFGGQGNDFLVGGQGNDLISGDLENDTLVGFEIESTTSPIISPPSFNLFGNEKDTLIGGAGADEFVLADTTETYYDQGGNDDYALIVDFNLAQGDLIVIRNADEYFLDDITLPGLGPGAGIFRETTSFGFGNSSGELVGFVQGGNANSLTGFGKFVAV
ncbi:calcium-binding protein [Capilliphycus salinus ALCB114379]|uniref:calcium-binding protein n=1 Tax=Capilliphycus salinus TaxID=2768948 RepID=UPI0039A5C4BD